jgi:hypothetical protein
MKHLDLDADAFRACFNQKPYLLGHRLVDHPLFTLPRILELARSMPEELVEYYAGDVPRSVDWHQTPRNGLSIADTIERIEHHCSWMVLKRVEVDPEYKALLDSCLDEIAEHSEAIDPGMLDRAGAIFVSSPNAVTPYHMDQEQNFLVQLRGSKKFYVYPGGDPMLLSEEELEAHFTRRPIENRNLLFHESYVPKGTVFDLVPGKVLHVPSLDPHWVQNGNNVSISFSLGFKTESCLKRMSVHRLNHRLRERGLTPTAFGASPWRDTLKYQACRALSFVEGDA